MQRAVVSSLILLSTLGLFGSENDAGKPTKPVEEMTLEELLSQEVTIATKGGTSTREAPGIVTLVTSEEIASSGARDLMDVLRLVPGLDFGVDVQGVVGVGVRGAWAHEGKLLLLVDGIEMNEPLYSTLQFGNRFPVDQIDRIEIIRGPGSAIYGGYAELGVVNIITRSADQIHGVSATLTDGEMTRSVARRRVSLSGGWGDDAKTSLTVHGSVATGSRSDQRYTDINGDSYSMARDSRLASGNLNVGLKSGAFSARLLIDRYHMRERDQFGENLPRDTMQNFDSMNLDAAWAGHVGTSWTITPRVTLQHHVPWNERDEFFFYNKKNDRYRGGLTANYNPGTRFTALAGAEYFRDRAANRGGTPEEDTFPNGKNSITYSTTAVFGQAIWDTHAGKITAGARWENQSEFGSSFVPRLAYTKIFNRFHLKALASRAFRAPGIENIRLSSGKIRPEKTTALELEGGYQIGSNQFVTANIFLSTLKGPIIYFVDPDTAEEGYVNEDRTGTEGLELEYRYRVPKLWATVGYSYYRANNNRVESYAVPGNDDYLLAFPAHKLTLNSSVVLGPAHISPSIVFYGKRYGYDRVGNEVALRSFGAETLINLYVFRNDFGRKGLTIGAGIFDLLGENHQLIQPYSNYHPPLPDVSREFLVRVSYAWSL